MQALPCRKHSTKGVRNHKPNGIRNGLWLRHYQVGSCHFHWKTRVKSKRKYNLVWRNHRRFWFIMTHIWRNSVYDYYVVCGVLSRGSASGLPAKKGVLRAYVTSTPPFRLTEQINDLSWWFFVMMFRHNTQLHLFSFTTGVICTGIFLLFQGWTVPPLNFTGALYQFYRQRDKH